MKAAFLRTAHDRLQSIDHTRISSEARPSTAVDAARRSHVCLLGPQTGEATVTYHEFRSQHPMTNPATIEVPRNA